MVVASSGQDEALLKESWSAKLFEKRAASSGAFRVPAFRRSKSWSSKRRPETVNYGDLIGGREHAT